MNDMIGTIIVQPFTAEYLGIGWLRGRQEGKIADKATVVLNDESSTFSISAAMMASDGYPTPHWCRLPDTCMIFFADSITCIIIGMSDGFAALMILFMWLSLYRNRQSDRQCADTRSTSCLRGLALKNIANGLLLLVIVGSFHLEPQRTGEAGGVGGGLGLATKSRRDRSGGARASKLS